MPRVWGMRTSWRNLPFLNQYPPDEMPVAVWLSNFDRNTIVGSKECGTVERQQGVSGPKCVEVTAFWPNDSGTNRGAASSARMALQFGSSNLYPVADDYQYADVSIESRTADPARYLKRQLP